MHAFAENLLSKMPLVHLSIIKLGVMFSKLANLFFCEHKSGAWEKWQKLKSESTGLNVLTRVNLF